VETESLVEDGEGLLLSMEAPHFHDSVNHSVTCSLQFEQLTLS